MRKKHHQLPNKHYSLIQEMMASPTEPLPQAQRTHQLTVMWEGLVSLESGEKPSTNDWRVCSDAINLLETLIEMGLVEDRNGLLNEGVTEMAMARKRYRQGKPLRLSGTGIFAVRSLLEDYAEVINLLPFHRLSESKWRQVGDPYPYADLPGMTSEQLEPLAEWIRAEGITCYTGWETPF